MSAENRPEWLPEGWTAVSKTTRSGAVLWCFYDPQSGSRFCSKKEVLQHLKAGKFCSRTTRQTRSIARRSMEKVYASTNSEENNNNDSSKNDQIENTPQKLPDGWVKEMRLRKNGTTKDQFYIDPVSGYEFRSLKDAFRYIETGDVHRCATRPKKISISDINAFEKEPHPSAAESVEGSGTATKRSPFSDAKHYSDMKMVIGINESPGKSQLPPDHAPETSVEAADSSWMKSANIKHLDTGDAKDIKIVAQRSSTCQELKFSGEMLESGKEENMELAMENPSTMLSSCLSESQNETFQEPSLAKQLNMGDEYPSNELDKVHHGSGLPATGGNLLEGTNLILKEREELDLKKPKRTRESKSRKKHAVNTTMMPLRASPRLAAFRADTVAKSAIVEESSGTKPEHFHQHQMNSSSQDRGTKCMPMFDQQEMSPTVNSELFEKLESKALLGAEATPEKLIELEGMSKDEPLSKLASPFGDSWPDPCIEFAFKTLIGDIPVLENTGLVQEYSHQQPQLSSAISQYPKGSEYSALHNIGSLNQNEHLAQLEPPNNHMLPFRDDARPCFLENELQSPKKLKGVSHWRSGLNP